MVKVILKAAKAYKGANVGLGRKVTEHIAKHRPQPKYLGTADWFRRKAQRPVVKPIAATGLLATFAEVPAEAMARTERLLRLVLSSSGPAGAPKKKQKRK